MSNLSPPNADLQVPSSSEEGENDCLHQHPAPLHHFGFSWVNEKGELAQAADVGPVALEAIISPEATLSLLQYRQCLETNDPTPQDLVTHRLRAVLQVLSQQKHDNNDALMILLVKHTLQPFDQLMKELNNVSTASSAKAYTESGSSNDPEDITIRTLECQVMMRLFFWANMGVDFLKLYKKCKLGKKQKKKTGASKEGKAKGTNVANLLFSDVLELLSKAAMRLPQSRPFQGFLTSCLDASFVDYTLLPEKVFPRIFGHFEIANPYLSEKEASRVHFKPVGSKNSKPKVSAVIPPPKLPSPAKKEKENDPMQAKAHSKDVESMDSAKNGRPKKQANATTESDSFLKPVNLVLPTKKRNSLLAGSTAGQRKRFVGSHFNSSLSNINSLFRQVKVVPKKTFISAAKPKPLGSSNKGWAQLKTSLAAKGAAQQVPGGRKVTIAEPEGKQRGQKRKQSQCFQTNAVVAANKKPTLVQETPLVKKKSISRISNNNISMRSDSSMDKHSARQVVAAARTFLRQKSL